MPSKEACRPELRDIEEEYEFNGLPPFTILLETIKEFRRKLDKNLKYICIVFIWEEYMYYEQKWEEKKVIVTGCDKKEDCDCTDGYDPNNPDVDAWWRIFDVNGLTDEEMAKKLEEFLNNLEVCQLALKC